jgi:biotin operon repressor
MSHIVVNKIRRLPIKNPAKAILWVLSDYADDNGYSYPSQAVLALECGVTERTVINCIPQLEACGVVVANRTNGRHTTYTVTPENFTQIEPNPRTTFTPEPRSPLNHVHPTPEPRSPDPRTTFTLPLNDVHTIHQYPSIIPHISPSVIAREDIEAEVLTSKPKISAHKLLKDMGCDDQLASDFIAHRKSKKAAVTKTALDIIAGHAEKAGISFSNAIQITIARNWIGFNSTWKWQDDIKNESENKWDKFLNGNTVRTVSETVSETNLIKFGVVAHG